MKNKAKKLVCLCLVLILVALCLPTGSKAAGEVRAAKRIISVVCDDSGSMADENRWTYANYAAQTMVAQLNEQDEFYITYMNGADKPQKLDLNNIKGEVGKIEKMNYGGGTPYQAVKDAYDKLMSVKTSDSNAQYWLIITTDGQITGLPKPTMQEVLDDFKGTKAPNGSTLNVVYLAMDDQYACQGDEKNKLYAKEAGTADKIYTCLAEIANLISSRLEADQVKQVSGNTVSFQSKLPIYGFSVLSQQSGAEVVEVTTGGVKLKVKRNVGLKKDNLFGNAAVVSSDQVISAGEYTIRFSEDVDVSKLLIQYEPAIGVKMQISSDGVVVPDPSQLQVGAEFSVEMIPVIPGTDTPIDPSALPAGIGWRIEYQVDGQVEGQADAAKLSGETVRDGQNLIRGILRIPGFTELVFEEPFEATNIIYGLTASQPDDLSYARRNPQSQVTPENSVTFTITNDGVPMDKATLERLGAFVEEVSVEVDNSMIAEWYLKGKTKLDVDLRMNDDGTFTLVPKTFLGCAFFVLSGEYTVTVSVNKAQHLTAQGTFMLVPSIWDALDLLWWLLGFLILLYLITILLRRKFSSHSIEITQYSENGNGTGNWENTTVEEVDLFARGNLLLPVWKPCWVWTRVCRVRLVAGAGDVVVVEGKSIEKNKSIVSCGTSGANPESRLRNIRRRLSAVDVDMGGDKPERAASDFYLSPDDPLFLETKGGTVYRIKLLR